MRLILPPPIGALLDRTNPLTIGLRAAVLPARQERTANLAVNFAAGGWAANAATDAPDARLGRCYAFAANANNIVLPGVGFQTGPFSLTFRAVIPGAIQERYAAWGGSNQEQGCSVCNYSGTVGHIAFTFWNIAVNDLGAIWPDTTQAHTLTLTYDGVGTARAYVDGGLVKTLTGLGVPNAPAATAGLAFGCTSGGAVPSSALMAYAYAHARVLTQSEARALAEDPWQIFARPRLLIVPAATGVPVNATGTAYQGESASGAATESLAATGTANEGETLSGSATEQLAATGTAAEGETVSGTATEQLTASGTGAEGETVSGTATTLPPGSATGSGAEGETASGSATASLAATGTGAAGETVSGAATTQLSAAGTAAEGESVAGTAASALAATGAGSEGESVSGTATTTSAGAALAIQFARVYAGPAVRLTRVQCVPSVAVQRQLAVPSVRVTRTRTIPS